jgi:hypothetical protein
MSQCSRRAHGSEVASRSPGRSPSIGNQQQCGRSRPISSPTARGHTRTLRPLQAGRWHATHEKFELPLFSVAIQDFDGLM